MRTYKTQPKAYADVWKGKLKRQTIGQLRRRVIQSNHRVAHIAEKLRGMGTFSILRPGVEGMLRLESFKGVAAHQEALSRSKRLNAFA